MSVTSKKTKKIQNSINAIPVAAEATLKNPIFFFNDPATTEIYTLSLHDALPIFARPRRHRRRQGRPGARALEVPDGRRSEEHTSELQSRRDLVCRLLLEKKK